jgi:Domain of unknown function (DUF929)
MAQDDQPTRTTADKERSKQQSRAVSGKEAARGVGQSTRTQKGSKTQSASKTPSASKTQGASKSPSTSKSQSAQRGSSQGKPTTSRPQSGARSTSNKGRPSGSTGPRGRQPRPGARPAPVPHRSLTTLLTVITVAVVLIIVVVLVVVKITSSNNTATGPTGFVPTAKAVVNDVTNIPESVYNEVGVTSSDTPVTPPKVISGQPPLTFNGQPGMFYMGAEYCPYCAAERWALVASLSRFGTWSSLGDMESSSSDVFPSTATFSFRKATFTSPYLAVKTAEIFSNQPAASGQGYQPLQSMTKQEAALANTYDSSKYFPGQVTGGPAFPFVTIGNKALIVGASYSPAVLQGLSRTAIASGLSDPKAPVTQAIVATSNYISASICNINGMKPSSVCTSKGVTEAARSMGLG